MSHPALIKDRPVNQDQEGHAHAYPTDSEEAISLLRHDTFGLEFVLATILAIARDASLRQHFLRTAAVATDGRMQIAGFIPNCWLLFQRDGQVTAHRAPSTSAFTIDFQLALQAAPQLSKAINAAIDQSGARLAARKLLRSLTEPEIPTNETVASLVPWAPLLEQMVYRFATRIVGFLNSIRGATVSDLHFGRTTNLTRYWIAAQVAGRATLFASEPEAQPWLADLADNITWSPWTPTYALIRERSLWLACCAARSAAAFGPRVVGNYLRSLETAKGRLGTFDSLFALIAIGRRHERIAASIASELELMQLSQKQTDYVEKLYVEAIRCLRRSEKASAGNAVRQQLGWPEGRLRGFATRQSLTADPLTISNGMVLGFEIIPIIIAENQPAFFPPRGAKKSDIMPSDTELEKMFRTAWGGVHEHVSTYH